VRSVDVLRWLRSNGHPVDSLMAVAPNVVDPTYARIHALILHMYEFQNRPTAGSSDCTGCARRPPAAGRTREGWDALSLSRDRFRGCLGREQVTPRRAALGERLSRIVIDDRRRALASGATPPPTSHPLPTNRRGLAGRTWPSADIAGLERAPGGSDHSRGPGPRARPSEPSWRREHPSLGDALVDRPP
jgi:hypothetical protein